MWGVDQPGGEISQIWDMVAIITKPDIAPRKVSWSFLTGSSSLKRPWNVYAMLSAQAIMHVFFQDTSIMGSHHLWSMGVPARREHPHRKLQGRTT